MTEHVELSVIIPTHNRAGRLHACLEALARQALDADAFEVVVIVDGSTDGTMAMLQTFSAPYALRTAWQESSGQSAALNRGIREARGRYCVFVDDDIVLAPGALAEHLRAQRAGRKLVAVGQIVLALPPDADWYARAFAAGWQRHFDALNARTAPLSWEDCYSGNLSAPRDMLLACGGFDTDLVRALDVDLAFRLRDAGCELEYLPEAVGRQDERKGLRELSRDIEQAGAADVALYRKDPRMLSRALGSFADGHRHRVLLRQLLVAFPAPLELLAAFGALLRNPQYQYSWHKLMQNLAYWRGVRRASADSGLWAQVKRGELDRGSRLL